MKLTNEQLAKVKAAKSAEELLTLAGAEGVALTGEEAAKYFAELHKEGELSDDELENVSGGCSYETGWHRFVFQCPFCGQALTIIITYYSGSPHTQDVCNCGCGAGIRVYDASSNASFTLDGVEKVVDALDSDRSD